MKTRTIIVSKIAIVAAVYAAVSVLVPCGSGMIQFRIAEVLNLLALIDPLYIISLTIGCAITNGLTSELGIIDVIVGSLATLISMVFIYKLRSKIWLASLSPSVFNAFIISGIGHLTVGWPFWITVLSIGASEFIIVTLIGVPLFKLMMRNDALMERLKIR